MRKKPYDRDHAADSKPEDSEAPEDHSNEEPYSFAVPITDPLPVAGRMFISLTCINYFIN